VLLLAIAGLAVDSIVTRVRVFDRISELRADPAPTADAARREARTAGIVGRIESRRIELDVAVLEGLGAIPLLRGVGHDPTSALPGESGNVVLAGHRDTHFRALRDVRPGDRIDVTTADGAFRYRVDTVLVVNPDRTDLLADEGEEILTLVTCYPFYWIGPAPQRLVVRASPQFKAPFDREALGAGTPETSADPPGS